MADTDERPNRLVPAGLSGMRRGRLAPTVAVGGWDGQRRVGAVAAATGGGEAGEPSGVPAGCAGGRGSGPQLSDEIGRLAPGSYRRRQHRAGAAVDGAVGAGGRHLGGCLRSYRFLDSAPVPHVRRHGPGFPAPPGCWVNAGSCAKIPYGDALLFCLGLRFDDELAHTHARNIAPTSFSSASAFLRHDGARIFAHSVEMKRTSPELPGADPFEGEDLSDPTGNDKMHLLRSYQREEVRRWIKVMCRMAALSPTALAKRANLAPSTLNRYLFNDAVTHSLSSKTLQKIEVAANEAFHERVKVHEGKYFSDAFWRSGDDSTEFPIFSKKKTEFVSVLGVLLPAWVENKDWKDENLLYRITFVKITDHVDVPKFALEVMDAGINQLFPVGSIAVFIHLIHMDRNPVTGEKVLVTLRNEEGRVQHLLREFRLDVAGEVWLWPRSLDPLYQAPMRLTNPGEGISAKIAAILIGGIRVELPSTEWADIGD